MRSDLIRVKLPRRNPSGGITWAYRWIKPREANVTFPHIKHNHNNMSYMDALKYVAYSKVKSDLFLPMRYEHIKNNILRDGLALDEEFGASFGEWGLAIYLTETPPEDKGESLLVKANIQNPLVIANLETLATPEDIFIFNLQNTLGEPEDNEYLGEEWTKKILAENVDAVIWREGDGIFHFAVYNPSKLRIITNDSEE